MERLATVSALRPAASSLSHTYGGADTECDSESDDTPESRVLNRLAADCERWIAVLKAHRRGTKLIWNTRHVHAHPVTEQTPCMLCAAVVADISAVSAATIRNLTQERERDDIWNSEPNRQARTVVATAESARDSLLTAAQLRKVYGERDWERKVGDSWIPGDRYLRTVYGPRWAQVMGMCYRLTDAEPPELVRILLDAVRAPSPPPVTEPVAVGRDWGIPARWLVAQSLSNIPLPSTALRMNSRSVVSRMSDEVSRVAKGLS